MGPPCGYGVCASTGMCECSAKNSDENPRCSSAVPSSTGLIPSSVTKVRTPKRMLAPIRRLTVTVNRTNARLSAPRRLPRRRAAARRAPEPDTNADDGAAQADQPLRRLQLAMDAKPAEQVGCVRAAGGEEPAACVLAAQARRRKQPTDQRIAVAHRAQ